VVGGHRLVFGVFVCGMVALRTRVPGAGLVPYGLAAAFFALGSVPVGHQELAALIAQQPAVSHRAREHLTASPFGTIHAALFSLPRPVGTAVPERALLAKFDPLGADVTGAVPRDPELWMRGREDAASSPDVNRAAKGDLAIPRLQIDVNREVVAALEGLPATEPELSEADELEAALRFKPFPEYDISLSLELHTTVPADPTESASADADDAAAGEGTDPRTAFGETRLYFEGVPMTKTLAKIEPWAPDEVPVLMLPGGSAVAEAERARPEEKAVGSRFSTAKLADPKLAETKLAETKPEPKKEPVTLAAKGEAEGDPKGLVSPAALLKLTGKTRARAERCLANAVYFEARGESVRGQIAVAQVVLNRAFSGYYPEDVCGVVYQGARRHLSCQFTFACDGIPDVVTEQEPWERAKKIATAALDGKIWLKDVGKSTHYHANYVNPYWVRSMRRLQRIGVHSFYRPRKWGDGSDAPTWGKPANAEVAARF
jgi:spore germination cell wall hydrolase CwlJ-like protein